jgi:hypothetical protein
MFEQVENEIISIMEKISIDYESIGCLSNTEWTKRIKEGLCELGHKKSYGVSASGCEGADTGEWLFDLSWSKGDEKPWRFLEMPLSMECEWDLKYDEISWDFEKLLVSKSKYKLMIFQQPSESDVLGVILKLKKKIEIFNPMVPEERYLFAGFDCGDHKFIFDHF